MFSASKSKGASSGYQIANSLRFRSSASAYLNRTPAAAGNQKTWTWSAWVKRGTLSTGNARLLWGGSSTTDGFALTWTATDTLYVWNYAASTTTLALTSSAVFRDPSSWYHIVLSVDTTQATDVNRVRLYVNGVQYTFGTTTWCAQNTSLLFNAANQNTIGYSPPYGGYFDGYMAEINFIDGQSLTPTSFGAFDPVTGVWTPKAYAGTYGTNGFKLNFSNGTSTTTLGYDSSGNGNNWTTNNISLTAGATYDWMLDSPTPFAGTSYGVGNYAVLNPVNRTAATLSNANLTASVPAVNESVVSSMGMTSGQWYAEFTATTVANFSTVGVCNQNYVAYGNSPGNDSGGNSTGYNNTTGKVRTAVTDTAYGNSYTTGAVIGIAVDITNNKLFFAVNGAWQNSGDPVTGANPATSMALNVGQIFFVAGVSTGSGSGTWTANFGQRPFAYTPPSGYKSLCTYNLPTPTIQNGAGYMAATLYTGTLLSNAVSNAVNGVSFQPDFVWIKSRSAATDHKLTDSVRGTTKALISDSTAAETTDSQGLTTFGSSGFTVGTDIVYNNLAATYVGWQWKAGGTAVTNTAGSITSSVSANTTSGFSIVTYTGNATNGATVGHGLGIAPSMIIGKIRSTTGDWYVWQTAMGDNFMRLNTTGAQVASTANGVYNTASFSSTVFALGSGPTMNASGSTFVAYCFAAIPGYSAFGSYTGNGSADGPFVYCGFRPRFVLIKASSAAYNWHIFDSSRNPYNVAGLDLLPNSSNAEVNNAPVLDLLTNGFKLRTATAGFNDANTYIYAAFAENPFKYSLAR